MPDIVWLRRAAIATARAGVSGLLRILRCSRLCSRLFAGCLLLAYCLLIVPHDRPFAPCAGISEARQITDVGSVAVSNRPHGCNLD